MFDKEIYRFVYLRSKLECNSNRRSSVTSLQCLFQHILRFYCTICRYTMLLRIKLLIFAFTSNVLQFLSRCTFRTDTFTILYCICQLGFGFGVSIRNIRTNWLIPQRFSMRNRLTDSNLNHTGIYLYSKGKIMIHLTFDYKTDEKCTTPGQYLKYHRTFQGLSTRELAEKVGIVPATLVLYENDRHPIKYSTAVALANVLGIDRNRLLDEYTAFVDYPYFSLLKKVRQDLSLTQIQMAELIGIGQTSYSGWEREIRVPRRKEYDKILAALKKLRVNVDTYLCQSASI